MISITILTINNNRIMADYSVLKSAIADVIKQNGNNEITGQLLQQSLWAMIASLGAGFQFVGIATPTSNPGTPDQNVFYIASEPGTYLNFSNLVVGNGEVAILKYNGIWTKETTGATTGSALNAIIQGLAENTISSIVDFTTSNFALKSDGTFGASASNKHCYIGVLPGEIYYIKSENQNCEVAFSTSNESVAGGSAHLVTGTSVEIMELANNYYIFIIPNGCSYLLVNGAATTVIGKCGESFDDKINEITDDYPVANSTNLVRSGGVAQKINELYDSTGKVFVDESKIESRGTYGGEIGEIISFSANDSWRNCSMAVLPGDRIKVIATQYGNNRYCVVFVDSNERVVSNQYKGTTSGAEVPINVEIICPANSAKVYINSRPSVPMLYRYVDVRKLILSESTLKILTINCGSFDYGDGQISLDTYKMNWRRMFNKSKFDILACQDFAKFFDDENTVDAYSALLSEIVDGTSPGVGEFNRDYSRMAWRGDNVKLVNYYLSGYPYYFQIKCLVAGLIDVSIFSVYFQPGEDNAAARAGNAQTIMTAIANSGAQYVVVAGDFNAWSENEYDIWKNAGYKVANCGYLGRINTLRDIPADNVIVSPNINIINTEILNEYQLNTDHLPMSVTLKFK